MPIFVISSQSCVRGNKDTKVTELKVKDNFGPRVLKQEILVQALGISNYQCNYLYYIYIIIKILAQCIY